MSNGVKMASQDYNLADSATRAGYAFAQGLTGQDYLTNYDALKQKADEWKQTQAVRAYQLAQKQQAIDTQASYAQMKIAGEGWQPISKFPGGNPADYQAQNFPGMGPMFRANTDTPQAAKGEVHQDMLEGKADQVMKTMYSSRSGVLGVSAQKVDQAVNLRTLINTAYNPESGDYNLTNQQYHELALGLASMLAPNAVASDAKMQSLIAKSAEGDINGIAQYLLGTPKNATSQDLIKNIIGTIDREGIQSETNRNKHLDSLKTLIPSGLKADRADKLKQMHFGTSYKDFLQSSPDYNPGTHDYQSFTVSGKNYQIPADKVAEFKKAKGIK